MTDAPAFHLGPPSFFADPALAAILDALPRARLVGGCVRDALAGHPVADIDLATPDPPDAIVAALAEAGLKSAPTGLAHGTVTAISDHRGFEVTTLRRDVATDGRHAEVAWTDDWRTDAARRDFTINAMSMTRDGAVFDYFGGLDDLRAGRVRFVGDPALRIAEDYLRILRFFRFDARYGMQPTDMPTLAAIQAGIPGLSRLSPERIWSELKRILVATDPVPSVRTMARLGVLSAVLPEATCIDALARLVAAAAPPDSILRLAALAPGANAALFRRLRLSGAESAALAALAGPTPPLDATDDDLRRSLAATDADTLVARAWLAHDEFGTRLRERLSAMPRPCFALAGRDALEAGVAPGPRVGALMRAVRQWWLAGGCTASPAACRAELLHQVKLSLSSNEPSR